MKITDHLREAAKLDLPPRIIDCLHAAVDEIEQARTILAGTAIGSLPDDYPLSKLVTEMWNVLQDRTTEGLALIGKIEELAELARDLLQEIDEQAGINGWCDHGTRERARTKLQLHFTSDWLKKKIEQDGDYECGAGTAPTHDASGKRIDGYGDPAKSEYNAFLADDGSDIPCD